MSGNLCCQGNVRENIVFEKSGKMIPRSCWLQISVIFSSPNITKQANLWLPLNVQKLDVFQLQGVFAPWSPDQGLCRLHQYDLLIPFHYLIPFFLVWHLCNRVIVLIMSGKISFHDWKSQGILLQKTCEEPSVYCLVNRGTCAWTTYPWLLPGSASGPSQSGDLWSPVWPISEHTLPSHTHTYIHNRGLNTRWCLTPLLLSLPAAAYLGQRGLTPTGLPHTTAQCQYFALLD